jgi:hypothetical protein
VCVNYACHQTGNTGTKEKGKRKGNQSLLGGSMIQSTVIIGRQSNGRKTGQVIIKMRTFGRKRCGDVED